MATAMLFTTPVVGTGPVTPAVPTGWQDDDLVCIWSTTRADGETGSSPSNWSVVAQDTGSKGILYGRIKNSSWSTMPPVDWTGASAQIRAVSFVEIGRAHV